MSDGTSYWVCTRADHWRARTSQAGLWWKPCQSCLYLSSFLKEKSTPSLCIPSRLCCLSWLPWWCHWWSSACQRWCASFRHSLPWILCSAEHCADPQKLASSSCLWLHCLMYFPAFLGFLYVFFCSLVPPPPPHLTSAYYHFWETASAFEMLYVQRVNTSVMCHLQSDHPGPIHYRLPGRILQWTGFPFCTQRRKRWRHSPFLRSDHSLPPDLFRALLKQCLLNEDAQANLNMKLPLPKIPRPFPLIFFLYTSFLDSYTFIYYLSLSVT